MGRAKARSRSRRACARTCARACVRETEKHTQRGGGGEYLELFHGLPLAILFQFTFPQLIITLLIILCDLENWWYGWRGVCRGVTLNK